MRIDRPNACKLVLAIANIINKGHMHREKVCNDRVWADCPMAAMVTNGLPIEARWSTQGNILRVMHYLHT
jgi:hypothetical protein